jgi:hypothetical protein
MEIKKIHNLGELKGLKENTLIEIRNVLDRSGKTRGALK